MTTLRYSFVSFKPDVELIFYANCMNCTSYLHMSLVVRKPAFCICKTKTHISFAITAQLISAFVFAIRIVQSLYYLNPKFQASSHLLWLYSPVCVGPGRKPRRPVFSQRGSYNYEPRQEKTRVSSGLLRGLTETSIVSYRH